MLWYQLFTNPTSNHHIKQHYNSVFPDSSEPYLYSCSAVGNIVLDYKLMIGQFSSDVIVYVYRNLLKR